MTECQEHQDWIKATIRRQNEDFHQAYRLETEPHSRVFHADIEKALNKAKAEGMRVLIKQVEDQQEIYVQKLALLEAREKSEHTAMRIERTENYMEALRYISEEWAELADKTERGE